MDTPEREGVELTHLDQPLFDGADATKRDLVDYLDACSGFILPELQERPLSVIRVRNGQQPFMQKNVPDYAPSWIRTVSMWAQASKREVHYALCDDRRTLFWFANQRAVEYHPTLFRVEAMDRPTYLILDIDPPSGGEFGHAVAAAMLVRQALADVGLAGAVKTSGSKGVHVYVPIIASADDACRTQEGRRHARRRCARPRDGHVADARVEGVRRVRLEHLGRQHDGAPRAQRAPGVGERVEERAARAEPAVGPRR